MITFSCNVPDCTDIWKIFHLGTHSTSSFFLEGEREAMEGGQPGPGVSVCHVPGPQDLRTPERPALETGAQTILSIFWEEQG